MQIPLFPVEKRCKDCRDLKPLSEFGGNGTSRAGTPTLRPECRECHNARNRLAVATNPERREADRTSNKLYRERLGADWGERNRRWREANPDYYKRNIVRLRENGRVKAAARRARQRGLPSEHIDPLVVLERDDGICGICGTDVDPSDFHIDHITPIIADGPHLYFNVQVAHPRCNQRKGAHLETWEESAST